LLKIFDKLIIKLNHQCYADSASQINFLIDEKVAKPGEVKCLNLGSYGGIDIKRFNNDLYPNARKKVLDEISCTENDFLFLYVGRLTRDKGVEELVRAFEKVSALKNNAKLILVGPYEEKLDALSSETIQKIRSIKNIFEMGFRPNPEEFFSAADTFCLPSYREGFGTVVLEAAACGVMTIGSRIPGLVDSIVDNVTGVLVELKNESELENAMIKVLEDSQFRLQLSQNAKRRAQKEFDCELLAQIQWDEYIRLLKKHS
jgi:glycosyltransferase involved in cell wall biosynthesis